MKVFVAGRPIDGDEEFSFTVPGELVHFPPVVCDCPDCGCDRSKDGFVSHKGTTSFVVRDLDLDAGTYADLLFDSLEAAGWVTGGSSTERAWVGDWARAHIELAAAFPKETPLRIDGGCVTLRRPG